MKLSRCVIFSIHLCYNGTAFVVVGGRGSGRLWSLFVCERTKMAVAAHPISIRCASFAYLRITTHPGHESRVHPTICPSPSHTPSLPPSLSNPLPLVPFLTLQSYSISPPPPPPPPPPPLPPPPPPPPPPLPPPPPPSRPLVTQ